MMPPLCYTRLFMIKLHVFHTVQQVGALLEGSIDQCAVYGIEQSILLELLQ